VRTERRIEALKALQAAVFMHGTAGATAWVFWQQGHEFGTSFWSCKSQEEARRTLTEWAGRNQCVLCRIIVRDIKALSRSDALQQKARTSYATRPSRLVRTPVTNIEP